MCVQGHGVGDAIVKFTKGFNLIEGLSNHGKTMIAQFIEYAFGGRNLKDSLSLNIDSTSYTTVKVTLQTEQGEVELVRNKSTIRAISQDKITEIVKRLFQNEKMKELFPDDQERIEHIMKHQVYGLSPTRIIYLIATNYISGFDESLKNSVLGKHFKQIDADEYVTNGTLEEAIQKEFRGEK